MRSRENSHLHAVPGGEPRERIGPSVQVVDAPPAVEYGGAAADPQVTVPSSSVATAAGPLAPQRTIGSYGHGLGQVDWGFHALLVGAAALGGGIIGYLASGGTARGVSIGALASIGLQGLVTAVRGTTLGQYERMAYGALALVSSGGAGYLFWTGSRQRGGRRR